MITVLIIGIILSIFTILLGITALKSNIKDIINRVFFYFAASVSLWSLFYVLSIFPQYSNFSIKATFLFGFLNACLLLRFSIIFPKNSPNIFSKTLIYLSYMIYILFIPFILFTERIVKMETEGEISRTQNGDLTALFWSIGYSILLLGAVILIYKYFVTYRSMPKERHQLKYVVLGFSVTAFSIAIMIGSFLIFGNKVSWIIDALSPSPVVILIIFTAYGILKGGLFDVRTAIVRSVTYSLVLATMAGIYIGTTSLLSGILGFAQSGPAELAGNVVISLILVMLFQPLRRFFDKITNKIFYKDNYNTDEFVARLNKTLAITTDLRGLLEKTSIEISKTLKGEQAFFFINTDNEHHITAGTAHHTQLSKSDASQFIDASKEKDGLIIASLLDDNDPIKHIMNSQKIELVLPLSQDQDMIGYLCLGEHKTSSYTTRDVRVLNAISNGLIIAIQNALAVQEIREFNITLQQRIAEATSELRVKNAMLKKLDKAKDEFVSMASHQLRTPLTSVKGYLSMVIEGDAGKVSKDQKDLLDQAFSSNEKMVHLVNDFLNVSRIQTGKFMLEKVPVDLSKLVTEEIDGLRQNAKARNLNLVYNPPKDFPILDIDEGKIRQVVMNFADNALYYSNANTDVNISLSIDGDEALFTVKDTGIGVPVSEQGQLFTKFYRATNARKQRPDGTGVGLYLAKKIITAHDGKIVFSTIEGQGSTFGFRLPISELKSVASDQTNNLNN